MRKLTGILLLVAVLPTLVLGVMFLLSSRYRAISAEIEAQDLSTVASDLASPEQLAKERAAADQRLAVRGAGRGGRQLGLGLALLAAGLLQLLGGILCLARRARRTAIAIAAGSLLVLAVTLALEGFNLLAVVDAALVALAAGAGLAASEGWARSAAESGAGVAR